MFIYIYTCIHVKIHRRRCGVSGRTNCWCVPSKFPTLAGICICDTMYWYVCHIRDTIHCCVPRKSARQISKCVTYVCDTHICVTRIHWCVLSLSLSLTHTHTHKHTHTYSRAHFRAKSVTLAGIEMTRWCVWHDSFIWVTWLVDMCDMTHSYVWHDLFRCVTWLIHMFDMTHSDVWHDSFIRMIFFIQMCDMTHADEWHDLFICVTWLIHMRDMTHSYVWRDSYA